MAAIPLSALTLVRANWAQMDESRKRSFIEWGKGVSLEEYAGRDRKAEVQEVGRDGKLVVWVLTRRDDLESVDFLCACETFRREGLVHRRSNPTELEEVNCYAVASVFTPPPNRKKGYARHMMRLLHWVLAPESQLPKERFPMEWGSPPERPDKSDVPEARFSVLYSDVGERFYEECGPLVEGPRGWAVRDPVSTVWDVDEAMEVLASGTQVEQKEGDGMRQWKWLDERAVNQLWEVDVGLMRDEMIRSPSSQREQPMPPPIQCTFLPHKGVGAFQHQRLEYFWAKLDPRPIHWGVCLDSAADESALPNASTMATWTMDIRPPVENSLTITRLRATPGTFDRLLVQVIGHAKRYGVQMVEVWNLPEELRASAHKAGGKTGQRNEHLPSLKWYGEEDPEEVRWVYNEKFCWC